MRSLLHIGSKASGVPLIIACTLLLLAAGLFVGITFEVERAHTAAQVASQSLTQKLLQQNHVEQAAMLANATVSQRTALEALVIPQGGGANFIAALDSIGNTAHVVMNVASVSGKGPSGTVPGSLQLSIQFSGTFQNCMQFVRLVETMSTLTALSSMDFQYNDTNKTWTGTVTVSTVSFDTPS